MEKFKVKFEQHFYHSWWLYLLVGSCFLAGLLFGFWGMNTLEKNQISFMQSLFEEITVQFGDEYNFVISARQAVVKNLFNLGKIFILGLTIIGLPLILVIIFTRGFVLGFTFDFFCRGNSWVEDLLALLALIPPNLLAVPAYFLAAVAAIKFSLFLIRGRQLRDASLTESFIKYLLMTLILSLLMLGAALIEGYFSPVILKLLFQNTLN